MFIFIFLPIVFDPGEKKLLNKKIPNPTNYNHSKKAKEFALIQEKKKIMNEI